MSTSTSAGGIAGVLGPGDPFPDDAGDGDDILPAELLRILPRPSTSTELVGLRVKDRLGGAVRVRQVEEQHSAVVPVEANPTSQLDFLSEVLVRISAIMCSSFQPLVKKFDLVVKGRTVLNLFPTVA